MEQTLVAAVERTMYSQLSSARLRPASEQLLIYSWSHDFVWKKVVEGFFVVAFALSAGERAIGEAVENCTHYFRRC